MHTDAFLSISTLYAFALVLARMAGLFIFLPLPAFNTGPASARAVLALVATFSLMSRWPVVSSGPADIAQFAIWLIAETAFGLAIGLAVSFILEAFMMGAQLISAQAGFSHASFVDPTSNADSIVLVVMAQLMAGLLFFGTGLDRQVLTILANSLESMPPGSFAFARPNVEALLMTGGLIFSTGVRLVLPVMIMMLLADISIGLMGRLNAQLQLFSLSMPIKLLGSLALLSASVIIFPRVFTQLSTAIFAVLRHLLGV